MQCANLAALVEVRRVLCEIKTLAEVICLLTYDVLSFLYVYLHGLQALYTVYYTVGTLAQLSLSFEHGPVSIVHIVY